MYNRSTALILRWLKVPPEPHPPHGEPASLRVFRAGKNLLYLRLAGWGVAQAAALGGIIFWLVVFIQVEDTVRARRLAQPAPVNPVATKSFEDFAQRVGTLATEEEPAEAKPATQAPAPKPRKRVRLKGWAGFRQLLVEIGLRLPPWAFPVLWGLKLLGFVVYLVQIPITYAIRRLDYELRWYMVTDRSLRIRYGVWKISESTMSFANIQQVVVSQGPLQRFLSLSDVKVQSAGGGSGGHEQHGRNEDDMHLGMFHGVTNGSEIRDLILERLRRFRESGLGDPDERAIPTGPAETTATDPRLDAARELLAEAKALRAALS